MKPKVTFVMPTLRERFFKQAYGSIITQSIQEWELFIYNGNPSRSFNFDDIRVNVINTDWNVSECMNHAAENASSEIIMLACDDDISFQDRARITYEYIQEGADYFYSSYAGINARGTPAAFFLADTFDAEKFKDGVVDAPVITGGWRIRSAPKWREEFEILNDYCFILDQHIINNTFKYTDTPLVAFRVWRDGNSFSRFEKKQKETELIRELYNDQNLRSKSGEYSYRT